MPAILPETDTALDISSSLIRFAAENKAGLAADVISKIEAALDARATNTWTLAVATDFWTAYDKLCSHLKPVTADTFRGSVIQSHASFWGIGPTYPSSWPLRCARRFSYALFALLIATALSLFVTAAGDTLVKEIDDLRGQGDTIVKNIRNLLIDTPSGISTDTTLSDLSLPKPTKQWANELNENVLKLFLTSDQLYEKANATVFRMLFVKAYPPCPGPPSSSVGCYDKGGLNDQTKMKDLQENLVNFFNYFETRREVERRRDQAATRLQMLKVCFLPALLGMLGACTYVVRMISEQVRESTFTSTSGLRHLLRVVLGSIVGIVITVLWTKGAPEGISVSALSFVAGYSIEPVFATIDSIAEKFRK